jgi:hypothetical protein
MSSNVEIKWYVGTAIIDRQCPSHRVVVQPARRQGKTLMARRGSLADLMQRGVIKSAWGDNDTPDDVGLSGREGTVEEQRKRQAAIKEKERLDEIDRLNRIEAERQELERKKTAAAVEEMEELDGFGSF